MGKRLSNRERIERMAEEAAVEVEEKDKEPKAAAPKATRARKASPPQRRMKFIWKVVNADSKEVATFPYREESEAQARAAELSEKTGKPHTVNRVRVPMQDGQ